MSDEEINKQEEETATTTATGATTSSSSPSSSKKFSFQLFSDIHLEFLMPNVPKFVTDETEFPKVEKHFDLGIPTAPNLVLCGDIGLATSNNNNLQWHYLKNFIRICCERYIHVFFVAGNHSFYGSSIEEGTEKLRSLEKCYSNFHFLDCDTFDIDDNIRVIGCTLWTRVAAAARRCLNDFYQIEMYKEKPPKNIAEDNYFGVDEMHTLHEKHVAFLQEQLHKCEIDKRKAVVLTHHVPIVGNGTIPVEEEEFENKYKITGTDLVPKVFNTDKFPALTDGVWCFGHSHWNIAPDYRLGDIRFFCNQCGYPNDPFKSEDFADRYIEADYKKVVSV